MSKQSKCSFGPSMFLPHTCPNLAPHRRDRTITGIGDFRWFCDEHIAEADAYFSREDLDRKIAYQKNLIAYKEQEVRKAQDELERALGEL